jgi:hypothetical protein
MAAAEPIETALPRALVRLFRELVEGADEKAAWILNPKDPGLLRSLDTLTATAASMVAPSGSSIAAHVDHLRYGLELLNRWSRGENPFDDADYAASWRQLAVSDEQWTALREQLRGEARSWLDVLAKPRALDDIEMAGVVASVAHRAYHLGAIRQINSATRGPLA